MLQTQCLNYSYWPSLYVSSWPVMAKHVTPLFTDLGAHGNTKGKCVLRILSPPGKCASQILVLDASYIKLVFLVNRLYSFLTFLSLSSV